MADKKFEALRMKRQIGLIGGVAIISGTMIGSGIFMSPQFILSYVGSPGTSLLIWAVSGIVAMLAALSYTEIGTIIPESGGEFIYILRIYGSFPAFFAAVTVILVVKPCSVAAMAISIAEYAMAPFYAECVPPTLAVKCAAVLCVLVVAIVNVLNVRVAVRVQVVFLVAKVVALTVIHIKLHYLCLLQVNLPRAVIIAISLVTGLYLLVNVSYLTVMTPAELMSSNAVAVTWGNKVLGSWGWIMSVAAALSAFGSLNGTFFSGGRVCFVAAREGHMFHPDLVSSTTSGEHLCTSSLFLVIPYVQRSVVVLYPLFSAVVSFTAWFFYGITLSGLIYLKIKKPDLPRPYKVPIILPILVLLAAIFLVLAPIIDNPQIEYLYVTIFILSGVIIYIPFIHYKLCPGLLNKLTMFLQLFLEVAPAEKNM
uniref:Zmp:0000001267 n=1 Tax=Stegastes partitus TaxID=144197 RepID=A0A3B4YUK7_9TELE